MKTLNPHTEPHYVVSKCCKAKIGYVPACMGDPEIKLCRACNKDCEEELRPVYEKVSKGTYRIIDYGLLLLLSCGLFSCGYSNREVETHFRKYAKHPNDTVQIVMMGKVWDVWHVNGSLVSEPSARK